MQITLLSDSVLLAPDFPDFLISFYPNDDLGEGKKQFLSSGVFCIQDVGPLLDHFALTSTPIQLRKGCLLVEEKWIGLVGGVVISVALAWGKAETNPSSLKILSHIRSGDDQKKSDN